MKTKVLYFTDPHNSDQPPRMRREGYREQILKKQELIIPVAKKVEMTIIGGDIFHQKKVYKISHKLVNQIMEIYREYGMTYIVPGNHDFDMSPAELKDNPLAIIAKLPNVRMLHGVAFKGVYGMDIFFKGLGDFEEEKSLVTMLKEWEADRTERSKNHSCLLYNIAVVHDSVAFKPQRFPTISLREKFDFIFTHGANGEYGHPRHIGIHQVVKKLVCQKKLNCDQLFFFAYKLNQQNKIINDQAAKLTIKLTQKELTTKKHIIKKLYGFSQRSFENHSCLPQETLNY